MVRESSATRPSRLSTGGALTAVYVGAAEMQLTSETSGFSVGLCSGAISNVIWLT